MTTPVRVLFVITDLRGGGAERVTLNVMRHLDRAHFEPTLFLLRKSGAYWNEVPSPALLEWGIDGPARITTRILPVLRKAISLAKNTDLVVGALELLPSYVAYLAAVVAQKPAVAWVHTDLRRHLPLYGHVKVHRLMIRAIYPRFHRVVFPSRSAVEGFGGFADLNASEVISNPCDIDVIAAQSADPLPSWAGPAFGKPTVLGVGSLENAHKGFDILLKAHAVARARGCDHNLVILGDGPDRAVLLQQAEDLHVIGSTFLVGFQANPYPFMRAATTIAVPSRFEAFGMVVTEAMALGTPVIVASSAKGSLEVIEGGAHGSVFPAEDADALATRIQEMIEQRDLREHYSKSGLKRVRFFAVETIIGQWGKLLWRVAKSNARSLAADPAGQIGMH